MNAQLKELTKEEAWKEFQRYAEHNNSDYRTAIDKSDKHYQFAFGNQYSDTEAQQMTTRGQWPMVINKILPYMQTITGMFISAQPTLKAMPQGIKDEITSSICNKVFNYVYSNSSGTMQLQDAIFKSLTADIGWIQTKLNEHGRVVFQSIDAEDVIVDFKSKDPYFRDASVIYISKWMRIEDVMKIYNIPETELRFSEPSSYFTSYYKSDNERHVVEKIYDTNGKTIKVIEGYHRILEKEMAIDPATGKILIDPQTRKEVSTGKIKKRIRKVTLLGYKYAYIEDLPETITEHCIIPIYCYRTKNVFPIGLTAMLYDYQRLLNKSYVTLLFNAQTLGSPRILIEQGSIPNNDIESFEDNFAIPASVNEYMRGTTPPIVVPSQQLPAAFTQLSASLAGELEFAAIPNEMMGGDIKQSERQLNIYQHYQFVMNKLRMFTNTYEGALAQLGKVEMQYFMTYADPETIKKVLELDELLLDLQKLEQKGIPADENAQLQYINQRIERGELENVIRQDISKYKRIVEYLKKIKYITTNREFIDIDISVIPYSYLASNSQQKFAVSMMMYEKGNLVDNEQVLMDSDIENKEEVIERMSTINNLNKMVSEMTTVIETYKNEIEQMRSAIFEGQINMQLQEHESKFDKQRSDFSQKERAKSKVTSMSNHVTLQSQLLEMKRQQDNALLELRKTIQDLKYEKKAAKAGMKAEENDRTAGMIIDI